MRSARTRARRPVGRWHGRKLGSDNHTYVFPPASPTSPSRSTLSRRDESTTRPAASRRRSSSRWARVAQVAVRRPGAGERALKIAFGKSAASRTRCWHCGRRTKCADDGRARCPRRGAPRAPAPLHLQGRAQRAADLPQSAQRGGRRTRARQGAGGARRRRRSSGGTGRISWRSSSRRSRRWRRATRRCRRPAKQLMMIFDGKGARRSSASSPRSPAVRSDDDARGELCHAQAYAPRAATPPRTSSCRACAPAAPQARHRHVPRHRRVRGRRLRGAEGAPAREARAGRSRCRTAASRSALRRARRPPAPACAAAGKAFARGSTALGPAGASAPPLGTATSSTSRGPMAAPACVLRMHREELRRGGQEHPDAKPNLLATSLVARLEACCTRLAATAGEAARPKLLVAGWLAEVQTLRQARLPLRQGARRLARLQDAQDRRRPRQGQGQPAPPPETQQGERQRSAAEPDEPAAPGRQRRRSRRGGAQPQRRRARAAVPELRPPGGPAGGGARRRARPREAQPVYTYGGGDGALLPGSPAAARTGPTPPTLPPQMTTTSRSGTSATPPAPQARGAAGRGAHAGQPRRDAGGRGQRRLDDIDAVAGCSAAAPGERAHAGQPRAGDAAGRGHRGHGRHRRGHGGALPS